MVLEQGGRINLDAQIDNYGSNRRDMIARHGEVAAVSQLRGALFSVTMGSNDFINNYLVPILSVPERAVTPPEAFINGMIAKYRQQLIVSQRATSPSQPRRPSSIDANLILGFGYTLQRLYLLDARKVVVVNVGPIGCIPYLRDIMGTGVPSSAAGACAEFPNQLAQSFNRKLRALVNELSVSLAGSRFLYADAYRIVSDIIDNYRSHGTQITRRIASTGSCSTRWETEEALSCVCTVGFEVADSACCYVGGRFGGLVPCGPTSRYCADRSKYVFWDAYHPSDAANALIARRILDGDPADISPVNVRQLVFHA